MASALGRPRAGQVRGPVRAEPFHRGAPVPLQPPPVLVHQTVMEAAHQDQVVQLGATAVLPPPDVVGLGESAGSAGGEGAFPVPVPELADHPGWGHPGHPAEAEDSPSPVLDHHLDPGVAREAPGGLGRDHGASFDLTPCLCRRQSLHRGVDHHGGPVGIGIGGQAGGAHRDERVGPAGVDAVIGPPLPAWTGSPPPSDRALAPRPLPGRRVGRLPSRTACPHRSTSRTGSDSAPPPRGPRSTDEGQGHLDVGSLRRTPPGPIG